MKRIVILQPGYIPWLGFFEQMSKCDIFVYLDDVQYTKNDWRNRNRIKTQKGIQWLTVPITYKFGQKIKEVLINNAAPWSKKHLQALRTWYNKSNFFKMYSVEIEGILTKERTFLVDLDIEIIQWIKEKLGLKCRTVLSSELSIGAEGKQLRLIEICKVLGCNCFYEGKSGNQYIDIKLFEAHDITIEFQEYHHPYYNQLWLMEQGFISHLSIIDLFFNHGPDSLDILTNKSVLACPKGVMIKHANEI